MMKRISFLVLAMLLLALVIPAGAQDVSSVSVSDQVSLDGSVWVTSAFSDGPGFVVIHIDNGEGAPGPVIGNAPLNPGQNFNIRVWIDAAQATPTLFAMLHADTGEVGVYEFGTVEGADGPVRDAAGSVITPSFNVDLIQADDQLISDNSVTINSVVAQVDGFLVIHQGVDGAPGPVAGFTPVSAGTTTDVVVSLDQNNATPTLFPMLHVDTGTVGEYEFGVVEGADGPVVVNGVVATMPIWTVPHMRVSDQVVVRADGTPVTDVAPVAVAQSVLAEVDGFLVMHTEAEGGPGPVAGFTPVSAGINHNVEVTLAQLPPTAVLWPMLHVDTGTVGEYEFGTVEGADGPVRVNDQVLTFPINAAPSITYEGGLEGNTLTVAGALMDGPGWLAIHSNNNNAPGPVIGTAPLLPGVNGPITIEVDSTAAGALVFPMLHFDTNEAGVYEFGSVEGADAPVFVGGNVVVGPLQLGAATTDDGGTTTTTTAGGCTLTGNGVNLRSGPGTNFNAVGTLAAGTSASAVGQATGADGFVWFNLDNGNWVRSDVVTAEGDCASLPAAAVPEAPVAPAQPAQPPAPAATEEASA